MTTDPASQPVPIRNAATIVVCRRIGGLPHLLMGQRGSAAAFMPDKFVFPGGAVDAQDRRIPLAGTVGATCLRRLAVTGPADLVHAVQVAALRELSEETGLRLGAAGDWPDEVPQGWTGFAAAGLLPNANPLRFIYRAITPANQPRRFDARFFLVEADAIAGNLDDFSHADAELSLLQWVPLPEARELNLPFITTRILGELEQILADPAADRPVPFFHTTSDGGRVFDRIE